MTCLEPSLDTVNTQMRTLLTCVLPDSTGMESDEIFLTKVHLQQQALHIIKLQEYLISSIPLLYIKWITNKDLLYSTENYIQYFVTAYKGKEYEKRIFISIYN